MKTTIRNVMALCFLCGALAACARPPEIASGAATAAPSSVSVPVRDAPIPTPLMIVHKNASCSCCTAWVEKMRDAGFRVDVRDEDNLDPIKTRAGIPAGKGSCHTAEINGYFIEGHVPAADIRRLLASRPPARGLALPGMPAGSPGMEVPDGAARPYTVELIGLDGSSTPFARHE